MRETRAYLAGVGTSGSLLAGAAALFLVGSAIVAFRGWPQISAPPASSNVAARPLAVTSPAARRLTAALRTARVRGVTGGGSRVVAGRGRAGAESGGASGRVFGVGTARPPAAGGSSGGSSNTSTLACSRCGNSSSPSVLSNLTNTISRNVSRVGTELGNQISGIAGTAGHGIGGVNPQAGSAIQKAGTSAGSAVTGAANSVSKVISGAGGGGQ